MSYLRHPLTALMTWPSWVWPVLVAGGLRLLDLGGAAASYDETFTAWLVHLNLSQVLSVLPSDVHPPLWYLIEWFNVRLFGYSAFALRLPSALFGALAAGVVWRLALDLGFQRRTAITAGILAAVMPGLIFYGQDGRMYTLLELFVLLMALCAVRRQWLGFVLAALGALYTQNLAIFYVAVVSFAVLHGMFSEKGSIRVLFAPLSAMFFIGIGWMPWFLGFEYHQLTQVGQDFWLQPLTLGDVFLTLDSLTVGMRLGASTTSLAYAVVACAAVLGVAASWRWLKTPKGMIILAVFLGAPILLAAASLIWRSVYLDRALVPSAAVLCILWAFLLCEPSQANRRFAQLALIPIVAISLFTYYIPVREPAADWSEWLHMVQTQWQPGDLVYHTSLHLAIMMNYFLPEPFAVRPGTNDISPKLSDTALGLMNMNWVNFDDLCGLGYRRAWLMFDVRPQSEPAEVAALRHILSTYPNQLVSSYADNYIARTQLYLVSICPTF